MVEVCRVLRQAFYIGMERRIVRRKKGKMKKEFAAGCSVLAAAVVLMSLFFSGQMTMKVQATYERAAGKEVREERLMKTIPLDADTVTQIPKYIVEEDTPYVLDESSIVVEETGRSSSEGADVVTFSRKVENLPDNDLDRIEKSIIQEGLSCELLSVIYEATKEDEDGIPVEYSAMCEYGGLKKYSKSYPSAWEAEVWYDAYEVTEKTVITVESEEQRYVENIPSGGIKRVSGKNEAENDGVPVPEPGIKKFVIKKITPGEKEEKKDTKDTKDFLLPLGAGALGVGLVLLLILWFWGLTAPLFALEKGKKYHYVGQIRMKKTESGYAAYLTKRLVNRVDIPVFKIKVPERIRKDAKGKMLQVRCPDGRWITLVCGKEVGFTLERE